MEKDEKNFTWVSLRSFENLFKRQIAETISDEGLNESNQISLHLIAMIH